MRAKKAALIIATASLFAALWGSAPTTAAADNQPTSTTTTTAKPFDWTAFAKMVNPYGLTDEIRAAWDKVATCETGNNWSMVGLTYSGGIGFLNASWDAYGGREFSDLAGHATKDQQIVVARRIVGDAVPDQNGCAAW